MSQNHERDREAPDARAPLSEDVTAIAMIDAVPTMLEVICRTTGLGFAAIARVSEDRWIACAVRDEIDFGLVPGGELRVETTICDAIRKTGELVVIDDVTGDDGFRDHPTPKMYGFRSYISVPIRRADGRFFGTLCAIDPRPARLKTPQIIGMFRLFADLIALHLDAQERMAVSRAALLGERQTAELREQFIAVLAHDLSDPLLAITIAAKVLSGMPLGPDASNLADMIRHSTARMKELIAAVTDFTRGRLGGGLPIVRVPVSDLQSVLGQVISEMETAWPDRVLESDVAVAANVLCDPARIAQLFTNLVTNALRHGDPSRPIRIRARTGDAWFELSVANAGAPIPPQIRERLFQPFSRGASPRGGQGLGLGLYIASEIARMHGGMLDVVSSAEETCFTCRIPTNPNA